MKKSLIKGAVFISGVAFISFILLEKDLTNPWWSLILGLLVNILSAPLYFVIIEGIYSIGRFKMFFLTKIWYRNQEVRLSISYLFRIQVKGKYLLVKNRKGNYYQLVGGAYKALPSAKPLFARYKITPDRRFQTTGGISKSDLRFMAPGKYVINMIDWFHSQKDRETSQWREFCEELLTTNILDKNLFRYIDYSYATTLMTPLKKAMGFDYQEILIYEIFDLIPNAQQEAYLENLLQLGDTDEIKWADPVIINTLGFDERNHHTPYQIGAHTKWAVKEKWSAE
ncbi:hypothetical protein QWY86_05365 [Pedobacter aquatilis]|uniref:SMODS-associated NUDIX domain-containing protein n=1 Tax=Pedobacter aquatilis TaxID=351343 RepID=UPI0025B349B5|nr:hypothetical protein [Pedobacter aquatilis]MDN3586085.1 hypothetical protein [Pedobacter aquatilis]